VVGRNLFLSRGREKTSVCSECTPTSRYIAAACGDPIIRVWDRRMMAPRRPTSQGRAALLSLLFFTLVTGPRRSLSLKLSDTKVYEPQIRAGRAALHTGVCRSPGFSGAWLYRVRPGECCLVRIIGYGVSGPDNPRVGSAHDGATPPNLPRSG